MKLISGRTAAEMLGVKHETIRKYVQRVKLSPVQTSPGRPSMFDRAEVVELKKTEKARRQEIEKRKKMIANKKRAIAKVSRPR